MKPTCWIVLGLLLLLTPTLLLNRNTLPLEPPTVPKIGIPQPGSGKYAAAVRRAGGLPVILDYDIQKIDHHIEELDGLLLTGGADIDPVEYGEPIHESVSLVTPERYQFEAALAKAWLRTEKPILGICLGCQLLNVVNGGSLVQDIPSELIGSNHRVEHSINIETDSILYSIFQTKQTTVNSNHHQSVRNLGDHLKVTARSEDGVIEAIEMTNKPFVVGVQWHPEKMIRDEQQTQLFTRFIQATLSSARF